MKTNTITLALLLIGMLLSGDCISLKHEAGSIPIFIGKGYNIYTGNPYSQGADPGFRFNCIKLTTGTAKTSDGVYTIPDGIAATKLSSCFSTYEKNSYTGTKSYQSDLQVKVVVGGGIDVGLLGGSFSLSTGYQMMSNITNSRHHIVTKASSEC